MPKENHPVNKIRVICPTEDYSSHYQWCVRGSVTTTDDYETQRSDAKYSRYFTDADDAKFFKLDNGIRQ